MNADWLNALAGGVLIGIAVSLMLYWHGRVTGISGIVYGLFHKVLTDLPWRLFFLLGLLSGGLLLQILKPSVFASLSITSDTNIAIAGLLVGFGTVLGSGCTSGHGVCGVSRLSVRSIIATFLFICAGVLSVFVFKKLGIIL